MNEHGLTPESLKQLRAADIAESGTFKTLGVNAQEAADFLERPEGGVLLQRLAEADPRATKIDIFNRAMSQLTSGHELPRIELTHEPLVKIVPSGQSVSPYSPFFTKRSELDAALAEGHALNDRFGLPIKSEATVYDVYEIRPKEPTEVFISKVAPTSELQGQVTHNGGAAQHLAPNRTLFTEAVRVGSIGNDLALHNELVVSKGLGAPVVATEAAAARHLRPGMAGKSLGVLAAAATAYDLADTTHDISRLRGQRNATAAEDRITRFATQNVGGWGGAGLGGMAGGAVGNAPGAVLGLAVGGIAGAVAGDKVADWLRDHKINHQQDAQGQTWTFDPDHPALGWARTERTVDMAAMERAASEFPIYQTRTLTADPALSDRLTYQASCRSIELALGAPPPNRDPYRLPVAPADATARLPFETGRAWIRDPQTEQWQQSIEQRIDGRIPSTQVEPATPSQAAALERQSQAILAQNAQHTPAAMASQFQTAYERNGWSQHGPMPAAVTDALRHPDRVVGSDGQMYERNAQGQWTHDGLLWDNQAAGNLRHELEDIHQRQSQAHAQEPTAAMPRQAPASEAALQVAPTVPPQGSAPHRSEATPQPPNTHGRLDDPHHPDHAFYLKTRELVHRLDEQNGRTPDQRSDQLASALTVSARNAGLHRIDQVALSQDATTLWGAQCPPGVQDHFFDRHCQVNTVQALHTPMEQSGAQWPQAMQQFQHQEQAEQRQQAQQQSQVQQQGAQMVR
jgi:uncharacterized protein YcfJ